ncbi:MAG TPA: acetylglutamate kinase [Chloroflexi bacterium]|nr:acetylglutamate kinase [Chloroflexota bacterium]|tara:strand:+ start:930 stop:2924 length:1995 start_codon:yes stop_codon:yes gene_type:complete
MTGKLIMNIIKIGGNKLDDKTFIKSIAATIKKDNNPIAIIHGGGSDITKLQQALDIEPQYVEGLRITDQESIKVAEMILSGTVNKQLVNNLISNGIDALGISGIDRKLFQCQQKYHPNIDLGLIGEIHKVRIEVIYDLVEKGITPVISPISLGADGKHYNVNADEAAASLAIALKADKLYFVSDVPGIMNNKKLLPQIDSSLANKLIDQEVIQSGMVPKVKSAIKAVNDGVKAVIITNTTSMSNNTGTKIISDQNTNEDKTKESLELDIVLTESQLLVPTYSRPMPVFTHGKGVYLSDDQDNKYLDFTAGIAVNALGYADKEWVNAVSSQANTLVHISNLYHSKQHVELAMRLVDNSFAERVFFCNSGTEANEAAIKFSRKYARVKFGKDDKTKIVAFKRGFHGRTLGSLSATSNSKYREPFEPLIPHVKFAHFNDIDSTAAAIKNDTCAVIIEPIQGEGGIHVATKDFLDKLRELCYQHNALLIFDEVQCGLARSGYLWAYQKNNVNPDIMTLAKPLAGGLPIGATLVTEEIASTIQPGDHGSTFAAGPLVSKAAQIIFDRVSEPNFIEHVDSIGNYLLRKLKKIDSNKIIEIRGSGLLIGIEFTYEVEPIIKEASKRGLLIISAGKNVIRLCPPLIINQQHVDKAIDIINESINIVEKQLVS